MAKKGNLAIVMQKVMPDNIEFWKEFTEKNNPPNPRNSDQVLANVKLGSEFFERALYDRGDVPLWVVSIVSPKGGIDSFAGEITDPDEIVLTMTVSSGDTVPFTAHMGIFKTLSYARLIDIIARDPRVKEFLPEFIKIGLEESRGTSLMLHSFAAKLSPVIFQEEKQQKDSMATTPTGSMRRIMLKVLPKGSYFIGTKEQFNRLKTGEGIASQVREDLLRMYYPDGIEDVEEPPLGMSPKEVENKNYWSCRLKNGTVVEFTPTPINIIQADTTVPWVTIDLAKLGNLYPWEIID